MRKWLRWLNPMFERFGFRMVELHRGHWLIVNGRLKCARYPSGVWRFVRADDLPHDATGLERFAHINAVEIARRKRAMLG